MIRIKIFFLSKILVLHEARPPLTAVGGLRSKIPVWAIQNLGMCNHTPYPRKSREVFGKHAKAAQS